MNLLGSLDKKTGEEILKILLELNKDGKTVIIVTHDLEIAKKIPREIILSDGKIIEDIRRINDSRFNKNIYKESSKK